MQTNKALFALKPVAFAVTLAFMLSGCFGSGGTRVKVSMSQLTQPAPPPVGNPNKKTISNGATVTVAVIDTGVRVSNAEFAGKIVETYNSYDSSTNVTDEDGHGTQVAGLIAGDHWGYSGNANLLVVKSTAGAGGAGFTADIMRGIGYAADHGAKVINLSNSAWQSWLKDHNPDVRKIITNNALWVVAAGNDGYSLSDNWVIPQIPVEYADQSTQTTLLLQPDLLAQTILVGRLDSDGKTLHTNSRYPGVNPTLQSRYLVAPGTNLTTATNGSDTSTGTFSGTSAAAPVVSAAAASVRSLWPHLTAVQTADILLGSANRTGTPYNTNTCGPTANLNCGAYYYGMGILDLEAALRPVGTMAIPYGDSVSGPSVSLASTSLAASMAFGDAFDGASNLGVNAFDDYGRNYAVSLYTRKAPATAQRFGGMGAFMQKTASVTTRSISYATDRNGVESWMRLNADGSPAAAAMTFRSGDKSMTGYRFQYGESNPTATPVGFEGLRFLSYNSTNAVASDYRAVTGVSGEVGTGLNNVSMTFDSWRANNSLSGLDGGDRAATRSEVAVRYAPTDWMRVSAGMASLTERDALLGTRGSGAMALREGAAFVSQTVSLDLLPFEGGSVFARYEQGSMSDVRGKLLVNRIENIRASQFAFGASYGNEDFQAAFIASSPLRVDSADATLKVITGRTLDGKVTHTNYTTSVAPSGRERNFEIALAARAGDDGIVQLNIGRTLNPGHDANAKPENSIAVSYGMKF